MTMIRCVRSAFFDGFVLMVLAAAVPAIALAQADSVRTPLPAAVKVKQGMLNVPALSPLWLLPEYAAKYNVQIEMVMFQRFADARTALVSGDIQITAFGPQDIALALGQGARNLVGVAGVGSGNDCMVVRKGEEIVTPSDTNRVVAFPYTKYMNAVMAVDQAAVVLLASVAEARRLGVPEDRWVYFWGGGEASENPWYVSERPRLDGRSVLTRLPVP